MGDFPLVELQSTSIQIIDGDRGVNYPKKTEFGEQGDCLFLDSSNLTKNGFDFSSKTFISKEVDARMGKGRLQRGDLVMNTRGTIGNIGFYSDDVPFKSVRINSGMVIIRGGEDYDTRFLYLFLRSNMFFAQTKNLMSGSVQKQLPVSVIKFVKLPKVEISTQQKIAAVLSALDAKIELNGRINAELESMARTLYDYWFVQYEYPTPSVLRTSPPNTTVLLSYLGETERGYKSAGGKMVWNEELKREIPLGWEVKKLGDVVKIVRGASPRPIDDFLSTEGMPWVKISDATATDNRFITQTKQFIIEDGISKSRFLKPDTLILSNSASPAIPRITKIECCVHDGWLIIDDYTHGLTKEFMFHYFEHERPRILNMGSGSIFKNLKTEYIKDLNILLPPVELLEMAMPQLKTISENIYAKTKESQTLTELRDWLLPMLMNGQVTPTQPPPNGT